MGTVTCKNKPSSTKMAPVLPAHRVSRQMHQTQHPHPGTSHEVNQHNVLDIEGSYMELVPGSSQYCTLLFKLDITATCSSY